MARDGTVGYLSWPGTTGKPVFGISRGIPDGEGTLLGVVVAAVIPENWMPCSGLKEEKGRLCACRSQGHAGLSPSCHPCHLGGAQLAQAISRV